MIFMPFLLLPLLLLFDHEDLEASQHLNVEINYLLISGASLDTFHL
jgi:hypothetical protein